MRSLLKVFIIALLLIPSFSLATVDTKTAAPMGDHDSTKTSIVAQLTDELDQFDQYYPDLLGGDEEVPDNGLVSETAEKHLATCVDLFKKASADEKGELKDNFYFLLLTGRTVATLNLLKNKKDSFEEIDKDRETAFFETAENFLTSFKPLLVETESKN